MNPGDVPDNDGQVRKYLEDMVKMPLFQLERKVMTYCARYAYLPFCSFEDTDGQQKEDKKLVTLNVVEFVREELAESDMSFSIGIFDRIFRLLLDMQPDFEKYLERKAPEIEALIKEIRESEYNRIAESGMSMAEIEREEKRLEERLGQIREHARREAAMSFPCRILGSHEDGIIRKIMIGLVAERHHLSNIYLKDGSTELEEEKLNTLLVRAIDEWKNEILNLRIKDLIVEISETTQIGTHEEIQKLQLELASLMNIRSQMAKCIGDRIIGTRKP